MTDETAKIARRLSGAIGRKVDPADIVLERDESVVLADGTCAALLKGNVAYHRGEWWRNGRQLTDDEASRL